MSNVYEDKIAVIITTFLRDELLYKVVESILDNQTFTQEYIVLIGDQGHHSPEKQAKLKEMEKIYNDTLFYYKLPFDCGLSYARNFLVKKAHEKDIPYCLISADSILFTDNYKWWSIKNFLEQDPRRGIIGFNLTDRIAWEWNMRLENGAFILNNRDLEEKEFIDDEGEFKYVQCDIVRNFFLAKTHVLVENFWDSKLRLCEHEDYFYRLKQNARSFVKEFGADIFQSYQVFWTPAIEAKYIGVRKGLYEQYRRRIYSEFRVKLQKKWNLKGWVRYEKK